MSEICDEPEVSCPVCGGIRDNGYCSTCWGEILAIMSNISAERYKIANCVRDASDEDMGDTLIEMAEELLECANAVRGMYAQGVKLIG